MWLKLSPLIRSSHYWHTFILTIFIKVALFLVTFLLLRTLRSTIMAIYQVPGTWAGWVPVVSHIYHPRLRVGHVSSSEACSQREGGIVLDRPVQMLNDSDTKRRPPYRSRHGCSPLRICQTEIPGPKSDHKLIHAKTWKLLQFHSNLTLPLVYLFIFFIVWTQSDAE